MAKKKNVFKKGDMVVGNMRIVEIREIRNGKITCVSDGCVEISSSEIKVFKLTMFTKYVVEMFKKEYDRLPQNNSLNWPDISRIFEELFDNMCAERKNNKITEAIEEVLISFVMKVRRFIEVCGEKTIGDIQIMK